MLGKILFVSGAVSLMLLILLLAAYTPAQVGPGGILLVFILMYISSVCIFGFIFYAIGRVLARLRPDNTEGWLSMRRAYYYGTVFALGPVMIVGLQSVGGVGFYELLLIIIFLALGGVYVTKRTA